MWDWGLGTHPQTTTGADSFIGHQLRISMPAGLTTAQSALHRGLRQAQVNMSSSALNLSRKRLIYRFKKNPLTTF
jgi:hypothetical protein